MLDKNPALPPSASPPTTLSSWAQVILSTFEAEGLDSQTLSRKAGIPSECLKDPSARIETEAMSKLWALAQAESGDDCLGLKAANYIKPTTFHALGFALLVSKNLREGFERIQRFHRVISDAIAIRIDSKDGYLIADIGATCSDIRLSEQVFDMAMAVALSFARTHLNQTLTPTRVEFMRDRPRSLSLHRELFACDLHFKQAHNRMYFKEQDMLEPIPSANAQIAEQNDLLVADYLAQFAATSYSQRVREQLIELLPSDNFSIQTLADSLNTSPRSLHRKLQKEGLSYQEILRDVREQLATHYLLKTERTIIEIAFKLGYTDASNFSRAFRRWYGMSPNDYRNARTPS